MLIIKSTSFPQPTIVVMKTQLFSLHSVASTNSQPQPVAHTDKKKYYA